MQATQLIIAITSFMLFAQLILKPFAETADEAQHWSSNNKIAAVGYVSQLIVLGSGMLSLHMDWEEDPPAGNAEAEIGIAEGLVSMFTVVAMLTPLFLSFWILLMSRSADIIEEEDSPRDSNETYTQNPLTSDASVDEGTEPEDLDNLVQVKSVKLVDNTESELMIDGQGLEYTTLSATLCRVSKSTTSKVVRTLAPGEVVVVIEETYSNGHHRARIGDHEWVSIETSTGKIVMRPGRVQSADPNAGMYKVIAKTPVHETIDVLDQNVVAMLNIGEVVAVDRTARTQESHLRGRIDRGGGLFYWCSISLGTPGSYNMLKTCPGESPAAYTVVADTAVYSGVSVESKQSGSLAAGSVVDVFELLESPPGAQGHVRGRVTGT
jgi:hypothetical protein